MSNTQYTYVDSVAPNSIPIYVNSSLLVRSSCEQFVHNSQVLGYRERVSDPIPQAGTALHAFASTQLLTDDVPAAMMAMFEESKLLPEKTRATLLAMASAFPPRGFPERLNIAVNLNGEAFVEQELIIPWREYVIDNQSYTIVLWARPDLLVNINNVLRVVDYKTSLYYKTEDALRKYDYWFQFKYYAWLLYEFGHRVLPLPIANLARDLRLTTQVVVAQISSNPKWSMGAITPFTLEDVSRIPAIVEHAIHNTILPINTRQRKPVQNGITVNACGYCSFNTICHMADESLALCILERKFLVQKYGPKPRKQIIIDQPY